LPLELGERRSGERINLPRLQIAAGSSRHPLTTITGARRTSGQTHSRARSHQATPTSVPAALHPNPFSSIRVRARMETHSEKRRDVVAVHDAAAVCPRDDLQRREALICFIRWIAAGFIRQAAH
jgi:hypothetical protein